VADGRRMTIKKRKKCAREKIKAESSHRGVRPIVKEKRTGSYCMSEGWGGCITERSAASLSKRRFLTGDKNGRGKRGARQQRTEEKRYSTSLTGSGSRGIKNPPVFLAENVREYLGKTLGSLPKVPKETGSQRTDHGVHTGKREMNLAISRRKNHTNGRSAGIAKASAEVPLRERLERGGTLQREENLGRVQI